MAEGENIRVPGNALEYMVGGGFLAMDCPMDFLQAGDHVLRPQLAWFDHHQSVVAVVDLGLHSLLAHAHVGDRVLIAQRSYLLPVMEHGL